MPRYGRVRKREIEPDAIYGSRLVQKFINKLMLKGKKFTAEKIVYDAFKLAGEKLNKPPLEIFEKALTNVAPVMEVKPRRVGG